MQNTETLVGLSSRVQAKNIALGCVSPSLGRACEVTQPKSTLFSINFYWVSPQSIPTATLPEEMLKIGSKTSVYVMDVFDPECFYFVLDNKGILIWLAAIRL